MSLPVMTVRGPVAASELGHVQAHEHVFLDLGRTAFRWDYEGLLNDPVVAVEELVAYRSAGGGTICEMTTPDLGRDPEGLRRASEASQVHIVMGCGWYRWPYYPDSIDHSTTRGLAARLIDEIEHGVAATGIRPGVIGEIGSDKAWVSGLEERVFRAAALAQSRTGLGLMTHTPPGGATTQLELLVDAGADPTRVAIGHSDGLLDPGYHAGILRLGAYLSFDLVGLAMYPDERRATYVVDLVRAGYLSRILLSTDMCHRSRLQAWGGPGYGFLLRSFIPRLRHLGLDDEEIQTITHENPRRFLTGD